MVDRRPSSHGQQRASVEPRLALGDETATFASPQAKVSEGAVLGRGTCVGRYVLLRAVGTGAVGNVYAAYDPELDRQVAVKLLRGDLLASEARDEAQARLRREARTIARLDHPNVVSVFDVGTFGDRVFLAMELVEGITLREWLATPAATPAAVLRVFRQAGEGLAAAHRAGIVHRDFKPSNVVLGVDGRVRVLDFGLARRSTPTPDPASGPDDDATASVETAGLTKHGAAVGTPAYMAPEQRRGEPVGPAADQYAFCASLFEALYRFRPQADVTRSHLPATPRLEGSVQQAIVRGLAVQAGDRFESMEPLLEALRAPRRRNRRWWQAAAIFLSVATAALGYEILATRPDLCGGGERRLAGVWDAASRARLEAAWAESGPPGTAVAWPIAAAALDRLAAGWVDTHRSVCEATHVRGEQSTSVLDRQMACLDGRLDELRVVVGSLASGDPAVLAQAPAVIDGLAPVTACADRRRAAAAPEPLGDPAKAAEARDIRRSLAESQTLLAAGLYRRGHEVAELALAAAERLGEPAVTAEAHLRAATGSGRSGDRAGFERHLGAALTLAQSSGHDLLLADAMAHRILLAYFRGAYEEAAFWSDLTTATIDRVGGLPEIDARRAFFLGMVANKVERFEEAIELFRYSIELRPEAGPLSRSAAFNNIGFAELRLGRHADAKASLVASITAVEQAYGTDHPNLIRLKANLGNLLDANGRYEEALAYYQVGIEQSDRVLGPEHPDVIALLHQGAAVSLKLERREQALAWARRAARLVERHVEDPTEIALGQFLLARALPDDPPSRLEACRLAARAAAHYRGLEERLADDLAAVEAWQEKGGCL